MPLTNAQARPQPAVAAKRARFGFAELFIISQTALPALLYLPGTQAIRLPIRFSAFGISLAAFAWYQIESKIETPRSAVQPWVAAVMTLLALMLFHPQTASIVGGVAQMGVYFAVMAPLFWAPEFVKTPEQLARIIWILLLCSGANAIVGVLQVYDPNRWLPAEFSRIVMGSVTGLGSVTYVGAHGERIVRPPGLFDTPGAVSGPAMFAALFGLIFAVSAVPMWKRILSLGIAASGLAAIYLSQVRVSLVATVVMFVTYAAVAFRQGRAGRASQFSILAAGVVFGSLTLAITLGGQSIAERVATLLSSDPVSVYQNARGTQLTLTFAQLLYEYPLGAGLARWGMAAMYFANPDPNYPPIWAEIQFTGWMIDGGVLMIALYLGALIVPSIMQYRVATESKNARLAICAAVILAANIGPAIMIISFTPFVSQVGIQYWFLAGALHGVASRYGLKGA